MSSRPEPSSQRRCHGARFGWIVTGITLGWTGLAAPSVAFDLDTPITATWRGIGLREWATRIGETAGGSPIPIIVDRRLDPDTGIRLDCRAEPLRGVLDQAAAAAGGEVAVLDSSIRIVPRGMADVVTRAESARRQAVGSLPVRQRKLLAASRPASWPAGATPRDLLTTAAAEAGLTVAGIEQIPHDHLPALSLPAMPLTDRLDLLLASYDLRVEWTAAVAAGRDAPVVLPSGRIIPIAVGLPARAAPGGTPPGGTTATGKSPGGRRPPVRPKPAGEPRFTLRVAAPLEELLSTIAARLGLTLDLDRAALARHGVAPGEIVRATVKDASRDELLEAVLQPLALRWKISDGRLRVFAGDE